MSAPAPSFRCGSMYSYYSNDTYNHEKDIFRAAVHVAVPGPASCGEHRREPPQTAQRRQHHRSRSGRRHRRTPPLHHHRHQRHHHRYGDRRDGPLLSQTPARGRVHPRSIDARLRNGGEERHHPKRQDHRSQLRPAGGFRTHGRDRSYGQPQRNQQERELYHRKHHLSSRPRAPRPSPSP